MMNKTITIGSLSAITLAFGINFIGLGTAKALQFVPPNGEGTPKSHSAGASRDSGACAQNLNPGISTEPSMQALLPQSFSGKTISARPTFFVYLPTGGVTEGFFSIKDENRKTHYRMEIPLSGAQGIVAIQLPEEAKALEVNKDYQWLFTIKCNGQLHPSNPLVEGWITRVEGNSNWQQSNPIETATSLGAAGIWYDTIATMASLRTNQPGDQNIAYHWQELLGSVGLETLAHADVVE